MQNGPESQVSINSMQSAPWMVASAPKMGFLHLFQNWFAHLETVPKSSTKKVVDTVFWGGRSFVFGFAHFLHSKDRTNWCVYNFENTLYTAKKHQCTGNPSLCWRKSQICRVGFGAGKENDMGKKYVRQLGWWSLLILLHLRLWPGGFCVTATGPKAWWTNG